MKLCQKHALARVEEKARKRSRESRLEVARILANSGAPRQMDTLRRSIAANARIALHFHPDRLVGENFETVVEKLHRTGRYLSQFVTGVSSGSVSAYPGGVRDEWERELFENAYHEGNVAAEDHPVYGALTVFRSSDGPSPRFGSSYFVLHPECSQRSTFTYGDTYSRPTHVGTLNCLDDILRAFFHDVAQSGCALGQEGLSVVQVADHLTHDLQYSLSEVIASPAMRNLDDYIEAQVHGGVELLRDVTHLVADSSYRATEFESWFGRLSERYEVQLCWHPGFVVNPSDIPEDFRGPKARRLARRIGKSGSVNAFLIGEAASAMTQNSKDCDDFGDMNECLRVLRQLWHAVVAFGSPIAQPGAADNLAKRATCA